MIEMTRIGKDGEVFIFIAYLISVDVSDLKI